jgi:hypothetical protein
MGDIGGDRCQKFLCERRSLYSERASGLGVL